MEAETLYEMYRTTVGDLTFDWDDLDEQEQAQWRELAAEVTGYFEG